MGTETMSEAVDAWGLAFRIALLRAICVLTTRYICGAFIYA